MSSKIDRGVDMSRVYGLAFGSSKTFENKDVGADVASFEMDFELSSNDGARYLRVQGRKYKLMPNRKYIIGGCSESADIVLDGKVMDEKHALILVCGDSDVILMDLKTEYGTFIDGERINSLEFVTIENSAHISFGSEIQGDILGRLDPIDPEDCVEIISDVFGQKFDASMFSGANKASMSGLISSSTSNNIDMNSVAESSSIIKAHRRSLKRKLVERSSGFDSIYDANCQVSYASLLMDVDAHEVISSRHNADGYYNVYQQPQSTAADTFEANDGVLYPVHGMANNPKREIKSCVKELIMGGPRLSTDSCLAKCHIGLLRLGHVKQRDMFDQETLKNFKDPEYETSVIKQINSMLPGGLERAPLMSTENSPTYRYKIENTPCNIEDDADDVYDYRRRIRCGTGLVDAVNQQESNGNNPGRKHLMHLCNDKNCRCVSGVTCSDSSINFINLKTRYMSKMAEMQEDFRRNKSSGGEHKKKVRLCLGCKRPLPDNIDEVYCYYCMYPQEKYDSGEASSVRSILGIDESIQEGIKYYNKSGRLVEGHSRQAIQGFSEDLPQNIAKTAQPQGKLTEKEFMDAPSTSRVAQESRKRVRCFLDSISNRNIAAGAHQDLRLPFDERKKSEVLCKILQSQRMKMSEKHPMKRAKRNDRLAGGEENDGLVIGIKGLTPTFSLFKKKTNVCNDLNTPTNRCENSLDPTRTGLSMSVGLISTFDEALKLKVGKDFTVVEFTCQGVSHRLLEGINYLIGRGIYSTDKIDHFFKPHIHEIWIVSECVEEKQLLVKVHKEGVAELIDLKSDCPTFVSGIKAPRLDSVFISNNCELLIGSIKATITFHKDDATDN